MTRIQLDKRIKKVLRRVNNSALWGDEDVNEVFTGVDSYLGKAIKDTEKTVIANILHSVIANGSADRTSIIIDLTKKYKKITGIDL